MTVLLLLGVLSMFGFIYWQWKMLKKYSLSFDKFKFDVKEQFLSVNGQSVHLADIDHITVRELEQPQWWEKALSKSACYTFMAQIEFHLKTGRVIPCTFNSKGALYHALTQLKPYIPIAANMDIYKPKANWIYWVMVFVIWAIFIIIIS